MAKAKLTHEQIKKRAREHYYANRERILVQKKERDRAKKQLQGNGHKRPVDPNARDALIFLGRALKAIETKDLDGAELFGRLADRALRGKL